MARKKRDDDDTTEWPETAEGEEETPLMAEPTPVQSNRPKTVAYMTAEGVKEVSTDPDDLDEYEGEYKQLATGEIFGLKVVEDDPHGRTRHLKNTDHYWAGTAEEFRQAFEKE